MSFAFIPRKVAKTSKDHASPTAHTLEIATRPILPLPAPVLAPTRPPGLPTDEEICSLMILALSNYSIWSDPKLLRVMVSEREGKDEGYISLLYVLSHSPILSGTNLECHENLVVKALRAHAQETIQVRMMMPSTPAATWFAKGARVNPGTEGNYQVRRVDVDKNIALYTRKEWEARTLYLENVPPTVRNVAQLVGFVSSLLSKDVHSDVMQHVEIPQHFTKSAASQSTFKGFALVVFSTVALLQQFYEMWPWDVSSEVDQSSEDILKAHRSGFRTLPKRRWDELNEEYLAYLQNLAEETTAHQPLVSTPPNASVQTDIDASTGKSLGNLEPRDAISADAPFPPGCLVFVKHLHLDTNKTTLRSLFASAGDPKSIDYVDFKKGIDTCYLRLCSAGQARALVGYFTEHRLTQADGLDSTGKPVTGEASDGKPVSLEIVQGRAEQVYWERVPEKIRRDAVKKALLFRI